MTVFYMTQNLVCSWWSEMHCLPYNYCLTMPAQVILAANMLRKINKFSFVTSLKCNLLEFVYLFSAVSRACHYNGWRFQPQRCIGCRCCPGANESKYSCLLLSTSRLRLSGRSKWVCTASKSLVLFRLPLAKKHFSLPRTLQNEPAAIVLSSLHEDLWRKCVPSHSSFGYIPHTALMQFIAKATSGAYLCSCPRVSKTKSLVKQVDMRALEREL